MQKVNNINPDNFKRYGKLIGFDKENPNNFQVVLSELNLVGFRIAVSKVIEKNIKRLACHPNSMECFQPISGVTLLCVAAYEEPEIWEIFLIDRAVCINKKVWHATLCLTECSFVTIYENAVMESEFYDVATEINI
ncbi:ureidoglycolate lyase [Clostridium lacusfryxellense]|uniref:ureidoglycolate lyase n=1 Tax=Clostridium lacusfryxellense TaxID=205328 RepID=UPI001C0B850B|nr:ureidoglycolate lyase [Clostridium lacusfryxellense]MBU3113857.1 hypothetical protein [Clostridium lacusfryxellense]